MSAAATTTNVRSRPAKCALPPRHRRVHLIQISVAPDHERSLQWLTMPRMCQNGGTCFHSADAIDSELKVGPSPSRGTRSCLITRRPRSNAPVGPCRRPGSAGTSAHARPGSRASAANAGPAGPTARASLKRRQLPDPNALRPTRTPAAHPPPNHAAPSKSTSMSRHCVCVSTLRMQVHRKWGVQVLRRLDRPNLPRHPKPLPLPRSPPPSHFSPLPARSCLLYRCKAAAHSRFDRRRAL